MPLQPPPLSAAAGEKAHAPESAEVVGFVTGTDGVDEEDDVEDAEEDAEDDEAMADVAPMDDEAL